jgi:hypothetical protein
MESIKQILMKRDGVSENEADNQIDIAVEELMEALQSGDMDVAEDICLDHFGLEPDYIMDLLDLI